MVGRRGFPGEGRGHHVTCLEAVTWDVFGTLVDFSVERDETPLVAELLDQAGIQADEEVVLASWVKASLRERGRAPFRTVRESLVVGAGQAARRHGLEIDPLAWARRLEALWASLPLVDGAIRALERLEEGGLPWALVTNLDAHVLDRLVEREFPPQWDVVAVCSEHARAYKPHPRPFWMALDRLGVQPGNALHVGDSPGEDRAGARAAGLRCKLLGEGEDREALVRRILGSDA